MDDATPAADAPIADPVLYETRGPVAVITLNRPKYANAQHQHMLYMLDEAMMRAANDDAVHTIVLRGEGKHFSAGHDIGTPERYLWELKGERKTPWYYAENKEGAEKWYVREQEIFLGLCRRIREVPKPTIAAVQGACIAGGLMLAWACDLIVASDDAYFSDPTVMMGAQGVEYCAHHFELGNRVAREFLMLGDRMGAERAYQLGMVNRVVPREELLDTAIAMAERIAERPRFALALTKQTLNMIEDMQGKRTAMDAAFGLHHLAHAHNFAVYGGPVAVMDPKAVKKST